MLSTCPVIKCEGIQLIVLGQGGSMEPDHERVLRSVVGDPALSLIDRLEDERVPDVPSKLDIWRDVLPRPEPDHHRLGRLTGQGGTPR
jgi:hypothetical protein